MSRYRAICLDGLNSVEPVSQSAPQLMWVEIAQLVIDDRYQRPLNRSNLGAIQRIAKEFRWARFSPVLIAPIEGGRYALIDGQHRAHAAALCGYERIPAMVTLVAPEEQAQAFIEINTRQIRIRSNTIYRAALAAGEDWAIQCRAAVADAGCRLMTRNASTKDKKPGQVFCIDLIRTLVEGGRKTAVTNGLKAMIAFDPDAVANFSDIMLRPWLGAVSENHRSSVEALVEVLQARRPWLVIEAADRLAEQDRRPKATVRREMFSLMIRKGASLPGDV